MTAVSFRLRRERLEEPHEAIEKLVGMRSRSLAARGGLPVIYNLVSSISVRDPNDKYRMLSGYRTWQSDNETLHYVITLRGPAR